MADGHVWMYWEDRPHSPPRAAYLNLCQESVRAHLDGLELHDVDRFNVFEWLPDLDRKRWERLPGAVPRSDYARTRLVHRHGGVWLDFDCIAMAPLTELLEPLDRTEVVGWGRQAEGRFYNNLFAARPGVQFLATWIDEQDRVLDESADWSTLRWAALGQLITKPLARDLDYHDLGTSCVAPVMWYEWRRFASHRDSPARVLADRPITVMLWNKVMGPVFGDRSAAQLGADTTLLARLLRIALGQATVEEESAGLDRWAPILTARFSPAGRSVEHRVRRLLGSPDPAPD